MFHCRTARERDPIRAFREQSFARAGGIFRLRAAVLIGRDGPLIEKEIQRADVPLHSADTLPEAVALAARLARPGDAVLLSPACASFDMFRNYEHRAQVFVDAVRGLPELAE